MLRPITFPVHLARIAVSVGATENTKELSLTFDNTTTPRLSVYDIMILKTFHIAQFLLVL